MSSSLVLMPGRVVGGDEVGLDFESGGGCGGAKVVEDGLVAVEWSAGPVLADLAEQPVLHGVQFRRAGGIVADGDGEAMAVAESVL